MIYQLQIDGEKKQNVFNGFGKEAVGKERKQIEDTINYFIKRNAKNYREDNPDVTEGDAIEKVSIGFNKQEFIDFRVDYILTNIKKYIKKFKEKHFEETSIEENSSIEENYYVKATDRPPSYVRMGVEEEVEENNEKKEGGKRCTKKQHFRRGTSSKTCKKRKSKKQKYKKTLRRKHFGRKTTAKN